MAFVVSCNTATQEAKVNGQDCPPVVSTYACGNNAVVPTETVQQWRAELDTILNLQTEYYKGRGPGNPMPSSVYAIGTNRIQSLIQDSIQHIRVYFALEEPQNNELRPFTLPNLVLVPVNSNTCADITNQNVYYIRPAGSPPNAYVDSMTYQEGIEKASNWFGYAQGSKGSLNNFIKRVEEAVYYYTMEASTLKGFMDEGAEYISFTFVVANRKDLNTNATVRRLDFLLQAQDENQVALNEGSEEYDFALPCPQNCSGVY